MKLKELMKRKIAVFINFYILRIITLLIKDIKLMQIVVVYLVS